MHRGPLGGNWPTSTERSLGLGMSTPTPNEACTSQHHASVPQITFQRTSALCRKRLYRVKEGALTLKGRRYGFWCWLYHKSCVRMAKPLISAQKNGSHLNLVFQSLSFLLWTIIQSTEVKRMGFGVRLPRPTVHC